MSNFLYGRNNRDWEMRIVSHHTLFQLIADLHGLGSRGICLDPQPDGGGGTEIPLSELMKLA